MQLISPDWSKFSNQWVYNIEIIIYQSSYVFRDFYNCFEYRFFLFIQPVIYAITYELVVKNI